MRTVITLMAAAGRSANHCGTVCLDGIPARSLLDERLRIRLSGFEPRQNVTLHLNMSNKLNLNFDSFNAFTADREGVVDLESTAPLAGHRGVAASSMDLFRSLRPRRGSYHRLWSTDVTAPMSCSLSVHRGVLKTIEETKRNDPVSNVKFERVHLKNKVRRRKLAEGRVRGTLFLPEDASVENPAPCVVTVHGGMIRGGPVEDVAALLASRGFAALALAYYGADSLPKMWTDRPLDLDYFDEAVAAATTEEAVRSECGVGLYGISKGGEVVLNMAAHLGDRIAAVVASNCMSKVMGTPLHRRGKEISPKCDLDVRLMKLDLADEKCFDDERDTFSMRGCDSHLFEGEHSAHPAAIPVHKARAPILFLAGTDDRMIDSVRHAEVAAAVAEDNGKNDCRIVRLEGAGHLLDLPYSPVATGDVYGVLKDRAWVYYGGSDWAAHSTGQERAWDEMLEFYRKHLLP